MGILLLLNPCALARRIANPPERDPPERTLLTRRICNPPERDRYSVTASSNRGAMVVSVPSYAAFATYFQSVK